MTDLWTVKSRASLIGVGGGLVHNRNVTSSSVPPSGTSVLANVNGAGQSTP